MNSPTPSADEVEKEACVGTKVMHDGNGNDLAEGSANADRRADGPESKIKAARTLRQVSDHENRDNAEYSRRHTIQDLDCHQCDGVGRESVENGANRQDSEGDEQQRLPHRRRPCFPRHPIP
jgi:hypothetical protein